MGVLGNVMGYFTQETSRNKNLSIIAGLLFFVGWWILIDAMSIDGKHQITTGHVFIGIFGTISFCMVNVVKGEHISEEHNSSESGARIAKIWLLVGFFMGFASIIAAVWVMIDDFINNDKKDGWFGVALLLQNVFILFASLIYKFGRNEEDWNE
ncbi:uncharacterized protein Dana_GF24739 [Drosophila ananassae]|uniref:Transmembrane protein 50A n=1 Tax=Drosophila ananassae TaxID=7217 RepID=B3M911_DROAN|nr:transmembrane protein 50B [Drosophila ananassae]EDV38955.1 uncharacterized protein Dana_GF24739 [Drosophila ananassae]KAH8315856.1 hypothetical protein KR067_011743 [Drosophila pandora]